MGDYCTLGVGCDETGVCYALAMGKPENCSRENVMKSSNITEAKDINEERQNLINSKAQLERFVNDKQASFHVGCNLNSTYRLTIPRYAVQDLINRCYAHAMNELEDRAKAIGLELE